MIRFKLGRKPRRFDPRIPHLSALLAGRRKALAPPPASVNYAAALPDDLGEYANADLGDCTCAGLYHALQVWSANANPPIDSEPQSNAILLYSLSCGYVPGQPNTDQGGVEQDVLAFALNTGIPVGVDGAGRHKIAAFVEIDPSNLDDVRRGIADSGLVYIGMDVPAYLPETPGSTWDLDPSGDQTIEGGHCVILVGYDAQRLIVISWGRRYRMTWAFFAQFVDEVYAIVDPDWITKTGKTLGGLTLADLETQMAAIKGWSVDLPLPLPSLHLPVPHDPIFLEARAQRRAALLELETVQARLAQVESRAARFDAQRAEAIQRAEQLAVAVRQHQGRSEDLASQLATATAERDRQAARATDLDRQGAALTASLAAMRAERDQHRARAEEVERALSVLRQAAQDGAASAGAPLVPAVSPAA